MPHLDPEFFYCVPQIGITRATRARTRTDDEIHGRKLMLTQAERFPDNATNAIALDRASGELRPDGHPQTGMPLIVEPRSHGEEPVPHAPAARVYSFELRLPPQAPLRGKG